MTADTHLSRDNLLGLAMLLLLTVALIGNESRQGTYLTNHGAAAPAAGSLPLVIDHPTVIDSDIAGAIRELKVRPLGNRVWPDLDWASDETVLEEYRRAGF